MPAHCFSSREVKLWAKAITDQKAKLYLWSEEKGEREEGIQGTEA